ncbi:MAG: hypothetical protein Q8K21_04875 [Hydrogenophaga sp.]|uniref:hypothetical protein n=1 Tax=Hydrogenophaga sp. TaxID=1904254 RepID=UPI0027201719|nr:hypothetical protein [Hydrogenophaga sp.]MDO9605224.1 hypothetical protein [Hydrogenophaga sp.]MDP2163539.1 hypothetical protein [Hydrogenophaga sp.]MDP3474840.1 hypothetical protein [Hydrogenophaga sp.]
MSSDHLANLLRIGLLDAVPPSPELRARMLHAAQSRLTDALRLHNSPETRFDCAYTAIRAVADAALLAQGYRTSTSKPGHHQTTLQCLEHTLGVNLVVIRVLDGLRKQRNLSDYDGEPVTQALLQACIEQAQQLLALAHARWPGTGSNG